MVVLASLSGVNWFWGIVLWIIVGLIAGWLIHSAIRSGSTAMGTDLIAGLIGGVIAGIIMGFFVSGVGFWWAVLVAFVVGVIVDWIVRAVSGNRQAI
jgi:uncharacterized membrane protein YeaQ/YmgE (transglycosylase-associated protein family)